MLIHAADQPDFGRFFTYNDWVESVARSPADKRLLKMNERKMFRDYFIEQQLSFASRQPYRWIEILETVNDKVNEWAI
jgi:hypothetical protein